MITVFHGPDASTHEAFQAWRRAHPDGFHMSEKPDGTFVVHWSQDKRENSQGRGCSHQGVSSIKYGEDKNGCYTAARKACAESLDALLAWANENNRVTKSCSHCDTKRFPFPRPA